MLLLSVLIRWIGIMVLDECELVVLRIGGTGGLNVSSRYRLL